MAVTNFVRDRRAYLATKPGLEGNELELLVRKEHLKAMQLMCDCAPVGYIYDEEMPGKGDTRCNRTACQSQHHVGFRNDVMDANYCLNCAVDIRFYNDLDELDLYPNFNQELDNLFAKVGDTNE